MSPNAFEKASEIEKLAEADLLPYMEAVWPDCIYYVTRHHPIVQKVCGDLLVTRRGQAKYIELKAEQQDNHGNFFIEMWSNRARYTQGWFHTCQADWLWYYFLRERALYIWAMGELKEWARNRLLDFPEAKQKKYDQKNDTWGRLVPIEVLRAGLTQFTGPVDPIAAINKQR